MTTRRLLSQKLYRGLVAVLLSFCLLAPQASPLLLLAEEATVFWLDDDYLSGFDGWVATAGVAVDTVVTVAAGKEGSAINTVDVSAIAASIDLGGLTVRFSVNARIDSDNDEAKALLYFSEEDSVPDDPSAQRQREPGDTGNSKAIVVSAPIPAGTRFITVCVEGSASDEPVIFTAPALFIPDQDEPVIGASYANGWTNAPVSVRVKAHDGTSGIEGIYDADTGERVSGSPAHTFEYTAAENGERSFYAEDYSGKRSEPVTVSITGIDKSSPAAPVLSLSAEGWTNLPVDYTVAAAEEPEGQSPERTEYRVNGGSWQTYSEQGRIEGEGETVIEARVVDEAGNVSPIVGKTARLDTTPPELSVAISEDNGVKATATVTRSDSGSGLYKVWWASGIRDIAYVLANGTELSGASFQINTGAPYTVVVSDKAGNAALKTITINAAPIISALEDVTMEEDTTHTVSFTVADSETDADDLTVTAVSSNHALLPDPAVTNHDGVVSLVLAPELNKHGSATVTVTVSDPERSTVSAFTVTVDAVNDPPVAFDDSAETEQDTPIAIQVLLNDTDEEGNALSIKDYTQPSHGTVTKSGNTLVYTPAARFSGTDGFTYRATDGTGASAPAVVTITVSNLNDPPVAVDDAANTTEDVYRIIDVLANDSDPDIGVDAEEALSITIPSQPANGSAEVVEDGGKQKIKYTPAHNWSGVDSFEYTVSDKAGLTATATVKVTVAAFNDPPEYDGLLDAYTVLEDCGAQTITFTINDVETATDSLMLQAASTSPRFAPSSISVDGVGEEDGAITLHFTPAPNANGDAKIMLKLGDGLIVIEKEITIHITPVNDQPVAKDDVLSYTEDVPLLINVATLLANDSDIDGDTLQFVRVVTQPSVGTLVKISETVYRFDPPDNDAVNTTFTYEISDGNGLFATATVTLDASDVNDPPKIELDVTNSYRTNEDQALAGVKFTISDLETPVGGLIVTAGSADPEKVAADGIVIVPGAEGKYTLSVTPNKDANGSVTISVTVSDGQQYAIAEFLLVIDPAQDAPIANDDYVYTGGDGVAEFKPLDNDYDVDGDTLSITAIGTPGMGTVTRTGNTLLYRASVMGPATDSFTYTITDGIDTAEATVNVSIGGAKFSPVFTKVPPNQSIDEDTSTGPIEFTVIDPDAGDTVTVTAQSDNDALIPNDPASLLVELNEESRTVTVTPAANRSGTAIVTLTATDSTGKTAEASFRVTVFPINDAPVADEDFTIIMEEDERAENIDVLAHVTDIDSDPALLRIISIYSMPQHGILTGADGKYTYEPFGNYYGPDSFGYIVSDGEKTAQGTVNITVNPINDAPYYVYGIYKTLQNEVSASADIDVLAPSHDVENDTRYTHEIVTQPHYGTVTINESGTITYTRNQEAPGERGEDSFTFRIRDRLSPGDAEVKYGTGTVHFATYFTSSLWVENEYREVFEDCAPFSVTLPIHPKPGVAITAMTIGTPTLGTVTAIDAANGRFTYTPSPNANGKEHFSYTITDAEGNTATAQVNITIFPVNDPPEFTVVPADLRIDEDTQSGELIVSFQDVDGDNLTFTAYPSDPSQRILLGDGVTITRVPGENTAKLRLKPVADAFGAVPITVQVSDGLVPVEDTFLLTVDPVNDLPIVPDLHFTVSEDTATDFTVMNANSDPDGDALTAELVSGSLPSNGTAEVNADGTITYRPKANYHGTDEFSYALNDGKAVVTGRITVTIENVNDPPVIHNLLSEYITAEDSTLDIQYTVSDVDGDSLTTSLDIPASVLFGAGAITNTGNTTITAHPVQNGYGAITVKLSVTDGNDTVSQFFTITVYSVNDLPVTVDDVAETDEEKPVVISVLNNDSDIEDPNNALNVVAVSQPPHGRVTSNGKTVTYTPDKDFYGEDTFTYHVSDTNDGRTPGNVKVTVHPVNDAPVAKDDTFSTDEDQPLTVNVFANDTDAEGDTLTITAVQSPTAKGGSAVLNGDNTILYTPPVNFSGANDTFTYTITDGNGEYSSATVTIKVVPVDDPPVITNMETEHEGVWVLYEDTPDSFPFQVTDAETAATSLLVTMTSQTTSLLPSSGILLSGIGQSKTAKISPALNANGEGTIKVTAFDGVNTTIEIFTVRVIAVNDNPTLSAAALVTDEDTAITRTAAATDIEPGVLSFSVSEQPAHGTAVINESSGVYTYTPIADYNGPDSLKIKVTDSEGGYAEKTVPVTVRPVNDSPEALPDAVTTPEDTAVIISVLDNDKDIDLDADLNKGGVTEVLSVVAGGFAGVEHGTVQILPDKTIKYTPDANWNGTEQFTYTVRDTGNKTDTAEVTITVTPVNDKPAGGDDSDAGRPSNDKYLTTNEDTGLTVSIARLLGNDDVDLYTNTAPNLEELTFLSVSDPAHGTITWSAGEENLVYLPDENYFGLDSFTYEMRDKAGETGSFTVSINVKPINDIPTITAIADQTILEDGNTGELTFTVSDIETAKNALTVSYQIISVTQPGLVTGGIAVTGPDADGKCGVKVTPRPDQNGTAVITLTVKDGDNATATTTFRVVVEPVNDRPVPVSQAVYATDENHPIALKPLDNDDVDLLYEGDILKFVEGTVQVTAGAIEGATLEVIAEAGKNDTLRFTPNKDWTSKTAQTVTITYKTVDQLGLNSETDGTVQVKVNPVNDAPVISVIADTSFDEDAEDGTGEIAFTVTDEEDDDDDVSVTGASSKVTVIANNLITVTNPAGGSGSERTVKATSLKDQNGEVTITLTATDSQAGSSTTSFKIMINPMPDAPTGGDDEFDVIEDTVTLLDVLKNDDVDLDTDDEQLTILSIDLPPGHGTAEIVGNETVGYQIKYTPRLNSNEDFSFHYTMKDTVEGSEAHEATFQVDIHIIPVNDAPVITGPITATDISEGMTSPAYHFTVTDVDDEAQTLTVTAESSKQSIIKNDAITLHVPDAEDYTKRTIEYSSGKWNGAAAITIRVRDAGGLSDSLTFPVAVSSVNDAPVAADDFGTTAEDTAVVLTVLTNDDDEDLLSSALGDELFVASIGAVAHGTAAIEGGSKTIRFTPQADFNGDATLIYTVRDRAGATDTATVTITVTPVNDPPIPAADTITTAEDAPVSIDVLSNDLDIDKNTSLNLHPDAKPADEILTLTLPFAGLEHGTAKIEDGKVLYTPDENWNGVEVFTYTMQDPAGVKRTAQVTVTVTPENDAPEAINDTASTPEDTEVAIDVLANDKDIDKDSALNQSFGYDLGAQVLAVNPDSLTKPNHGSVALNAQGKVVFTPDENWNGVTHFTYTAMDPSGAESLPATVTVTVTQVNDQPDAKDDTAATVEDVPVTIDVLDNDEDTDAVASLNANPGAETKHIKADGFSGVTNGTVTIAGDKLQFTPNEDWNGITTFTYTMVDQGGLSSSADVTVTVRAANDAPVANDDSAETDEDIPAVIDALANDTDVDTDADLNKDPDYDPASETKSVKPDSFAGVTNGAVAINPDGNIVFTPDENWNGITDFTYQAVDKAGAVSNPARVTVTVNAINNSPTAMPDEAVTPEDTAVVIDAVANDKDVDLTTGNDEDLLIISTADVHNGTVTISGDQKAVTFTPAEHWNGVEEFKYTIEDRDGHKSTGLITVTVTPVNDAPVAADDEREIDEDGYAVISVLANDSDPDIGREGDTLTVISAGPAEHGTVEITGSGTTVAYTPHENWFGVESFSYTIEDEQQLSDTATITITVHSVNDAPTIPTLLTPNTGDYFKDTQTVPVTWELSTDVEGSDVTYDLYFYDGASESLLVGDLSETKYDHLLIDTDLTTDDVRYRVVATDGAATAQDIGEDFIIDNEAPRNITVRTLTPIGNEIADDDWTNTDVRFSLSDGTDLLPFGYGYRTSTDDPYTGLTSGQEVLFEETGEYTVYYRAADILDNAFTAFRRIRVDKVAPLVPLIEYAEASGKDKVTVTFTPYDDPGGSGNATITFPNRKRVSTDEPVKWETKKNGTFSFVITDVAGNVTGFTATISTIKPPSAPPSSPPSGDDDGGSSSSAVSSASSSGLTSSSASSTVSSSPASSSSSSGSSSSSAQSSSQAASSGASSHTPGDEEEKGSSGSSQSPDSSSDGEGGSSKPGKGGTPGSDSPLQAFFTPLLTFAKSIQGFFTDVSVLSSNVAFDNGSFPWLLLLLAGLVLLLILFLWRPVIVEYEGRRDSGKEYRKVRRRFAHCPKKEKTLELDVTFHPDRVVLEKVTVTFRRLFTRRMRVRDVQVKFNDKTIFLSRVKKDQIKRWTTSIQL